MISGDFHQLPPVAERNWSEGTTLPVCFAFDAKTWNRCVGRPITLTQVFRQKDQGEQFTQYSPRILLTIDLSEFVAMLNAMRVGKLEPETIAKFKALSRPIIYANGIEPSDL